MKIFTLVFFIFLSQCGSHFGFYQGHILTETKKPLTNLKVYEKYNPSNYTYTDDNGYFKLEKAEGSRSIYLIVESTEEKIVDSMQTTRSSGGERINYYFIEGRNDTLFLRN